MTPSSMLFLCNEAGAKSSTDSASTVKLRTSGRGKNVSLEVEDVSREFGTNAEPALLDLLEIATFVYVADQMKQRGANDAENAGATWRRRMQFQIPVRVPRLWMSPEAGDALTGLLSYLSEDEYEFTFSEYKTPPPLETYLDFTDRTLTRSPQSVILFSGGIDSLGGVLEEVVRDKRPAFLVTHESNKTYRQRQRTLRQMISNAPNAVKPNFMTVRINKEHRSEREYTQRARSFLYASLAAVAARMAKLSEIRFYENGVVSLNVPMSPQVVGSRATRTTHPKVLASMSKLFSIITNQQFTVTNRYLLKTKTDVVKGIVDLGCGSMLEWSTSCTHTRKYRREHPHCGECSQCIDRRIAILAAGASSFEPATRYGHQLWTDPRPPGESRVMIGSYLETARRFAKVESAEFFSKYGEAARALPYMNMAADVAAQSIFDLHRRHGLQVMSVLEEAIKQHLPKLVDRTLDSSCALRLVHDPNPNIGKHTEVRVVELFKETHPPFELVNLGEAWRLRFNGAERLFLQSVGMVYLHELISNPNKRFSVAQLFVRARPQLRDVPAARSEAVFDKATAKAFRLRLREIEDEIDDSMRTNNTTALSVANNEKQLLLRELRNAGFAGRDKEESNDSRNLRNRVRNAYMEVFKKIKAKIPPAGDHFAQFISFSSTAIYAPKEEIPWHLHG